MELWCNQVPILNWNRTVHDGMGPSFGSDVGYDFLLPREILMRILSVSRCHSQERTYSLGPPYLS